MELKPFKEQVDARLESLKVPGGTCGEYYIKTGGEAEVYASCDTVLTKTIMGEDVYSDLSEKERREWIDHINSFSAPDGTYPSKRHALEHVNGTVIGALGVLGGKVKYACPLYDVFSTVEKACDWLEKLDWSGLWNASHMFWGGMHCYSMSKYCTDEWRNGVIDWLNKNLDERTGWWRKGFEPTSRYQPLGGGAHIWPIYEHHNRAFPYPERVIDSILALWTGRRFASDELPYMDLFNWYMDLDALYGLSYMSKLAVGHRHDEICEKAYIYGQTVESNLDLFFSENHDIHSLLGCVSVIGLLRQLLPGEYKDNVEWTDIFSDRKLYRTNLVEI